MPSHKFDLGHAIRLAEPAAVKKIADADRGSFTGYASVFGNADSYGERTAPGAFEASLARWRSDGEMPPLLWNTCPTRHRPRRFAARGRPRPAGVRRVEP